MSAHQYISLSLFFFFSFGCTKKGQNLSRKQKVQGKYSKKKKWDKGNMNLFCKNLGLILGQ